MPNGIGPTSGKRKLLAGVTSSFFRYGGPVWIETIKKKRNKVKLNSVHRLSAIREASAYRTTSFDAACAISGLMLVCILLKEDYRCHKSKLETGDRKRKRQREISMEEWQSEWKSLYRR